MKVAHSFHKKDVVSYSYILDCIYLCKREYILYKHNFFSIYRASPFIIEVIRNNPPEIIRKKTFKIVGDPS